MFCFSTLTLLFEKTFNVPMIKKDYENSKTNDRDTKIRTFQHKAKISNALKNRFLEKKHRDSIDFSITKRDIITILTKQKISMANKGKKRNDTIRKKISMSLKYRSLSDAHRQNLKKKFSGMNNPMFGKRHSKKTKRRISQSLIRARINNRINL